MTDEKKAVKVQILVDVPLQAIADQLCAALEGGSNYWIEGVALDPLRPVPEGAQAEYLSDVPGAGGALRIKVDDPGDDPKLRGAKILDLDRCVDGLRVCAALYPKHFGDILDESGDAVTGDVYLQCCLFGEVIFS